MSNTYVDVSNTTSTTVKRSTDTDVNGSNTVNNVIYSVNVDADLVYSKEEAPHNSNKTDTDSSLECYDHLHVYDKRETMLNENLYCSNVGLEVILTLHTMIQLWVLPKGKTLTVFMTTPWRACIAAMSVLEAILILHMIIQPWVLPNGKTLTVFMTTPWRACIAAMSGLEVILILHMIIQPWVLPKRKTLTICMTTPWRTWTTRAPIYRLCLVYAVSSKFKP
jgi:hypothetical protein